MSSKFRVFTRRLFVVLNVLAVLAFLLACIAPYLDPRKWWVLSLLALGFPFLLFVVLIFLVIWLFVKRKNALISGIALVLGIKSISVFFSFHIPKRFEEQKTPGTIRVATWNVARFIEMIRNNNTGSQTRLKMLDQIGKQNADILCLQEFVHSTNPDWYANLDEIREKYNYPYYYYSHDEDGDRLFNGTVIFSRLPIIDSGKVRFPRPTLPEALVYADIKVQNRIIRVYSTHLQSLQFKKSDYEKISQIKDAEDGLVDNSRTIFSKLKTGFVNRSIQTDLTRQLLNDSPYPVLFCGDLNDIPNSYTYFTIRDDMQDAFLEKGGGIGRTFTGLSPTLRIDYIFADERFKIHQFKRITKNYSDHYMLVSDVELRKGK